MAHHVLHVDREHRLPVLVDLASAPGRTVVFTRTKHGAKALARQLNKSGVPTVELHGNLGQGARTRNLDAFHSGKAAALVATDIAARGIHVDDVALVVHADPPAEHKAYLHRSGRTARAGNAGTVVTLMTSEQVRDVRDLTRAAGIKPTTTRINGSTHPVLARARPRRADADRRASRPRLPRRRPLGHGQGQAPSEAATATGETAAGADAAPGRARPRARTSGPARPRASARRARRRRARPRSPARVGASRRTPNRSSSGGSHSAASFSSGRR